MSNELPLALIVEVSINQLPAGIGAFNVNNLALFTSEVPQSTSGLGYDVFMTPEGVIKAYGTASKTASMAAEIFAQSPNILAGGGKLVVAPLLTIPVAVTAVQKILIGASPASGTFTLNGSAPLAFNISAANLQTAIHLQTGFSNVTVAAITGGFNVTFTGVSGPVVPLTAVSSILDSESAPVTVTVTTTTPGVAQGIESLLSAITRLQAIVSFCGVIKENAYVTGELMEAAVYVQTQNMILFAQSASAADAAHSTGLFYQIMEAGLSKTRCLMYLNSDFGAATLMAAAYAGRALSTAFAGSNTTQNMHLKQLIGILSDSNMSLTQYLLCQAAGCDVYASVQGRASVLSSGENRFFDSVYNQLWLSTSIQIGVFNVQATTPTKIPQTEAGMSQLKAAVQAVYDQAVANGYLAPGAWSGGTFGSQPDFMRNISSMGYYIWSSPVALQAQVDRTARLAPLIQSAGKEAGGVNSSSIQVTITS